MNKETDMFIGTSAVMKNGHVATCIAYRSRDDCDFQFDNGFIKRNAKWQNFKMRRLGFRLLDAPIGVKIYQTRLNQNAICIDINKETLICTIQFDDGTIRDDVTWANFIRGHVGKVSKTKIQNDANIVGLKLLMNCGVWAECIEYNGFRNLTIKFDDGCVKYNVEKRASLNGAVSSDITNKYAILGEKKIMSCGFEATVIADRGCHDIDVQFEDGKIVRHRERAAFRYGQISHPDIINSYRDSVAQRLIFHYISIYFPDAKCCYRPDWLMSYYSGRNLELDIWIPNKKVGIEFDGNFNSNTELTANNIMKSVLIEDSDNIDKLYVILVDDAIEFNNPKYFSYNITYTYGYLYYENIITIIKDILLELGVQPDFNLDFSIIKNLQNLRRY